jgi:two-component system KDP operon response regulator KdpE
VIGGKTGPMSLEYTTREAENPREPRPSEKRVDASPPALRSPLALAPSVLIVEDDLRMRRYLRGTLADQRLRVVETKSGAEALAQAATHNPDLVVLDYGLPDMDGIEVTKKLREWTAMPIIIVSARHAEPEKIAAFDAGVNDYLTKPFSTGELLARVRVWLRETQRAAAGSLTSVLEVGPVRVDLARRVAFLGNQEVHLSLTQYKLLAALMRNAGKVMTHEQLLLAVWGPRYVRETQYLRVYMGHLRQKFEEDPARPRYFLTEPGVGYRLRAPATTS